MQFEKIIIFTIVHEGKTWQIQTREGMYDSLMCFISDHVPVSNFGICYGGGSCGTCGVEVKDDCNGARRFVPSCEIPINDEITNKTINIL